MLKITTELLTNLGFKQQNPPHIWDYAMGGEHAYFRFVNYPEYNNGDYWMFSYRGEHSVLCSDLMAMIRVVAFTAHSKGLTETQDKLHDALGLDRLLERAIDRARQDDD